MGDSAILDNAYYWNNWDVYPMFFAKKRNMYKNMASNNDWYFTRNRRVYRSQAFIYN